jgi:hypothetical protein
MKKSIDKPFRKINRLDRKIPGITFALSHQIRFSGSIPISLKKRLLKNFGDSKGRLKGISKRLKEDYCKDFFRTTDEKDIFENNEVRKASRNEKNKIVDQSGIDIGEFQKWLNGTCVAYCEEKEVKK